MFVVVVVDYFVVGCVELFVICEFVEVVVVD